MTRFHAVILILLLATNACGASADDRLERIMVLWPSRDFDTLRVRINEALTAYREARDPRREAIAYLFLSLVDMNRGNVQNTRMHFGEATTRLESAGDYVGAALAYWMFAEHERLSGAQSDHVLAFYEKSLARLEKARSPSAPFSIDALMVIGPVVGVPPAEYEPNAATPEINKPIVLQLLEVFMRTGYGAEFLGIGELEKADVQLLRAKNAAAIFGGRLDPPIDLHIGNLRRRQWRLDEARESYRRALEGLKVLQPVGILTPKRLRVEVFGELAELEMLSGRIDDALAWNDRALELVRAEKSPETEVIVLKRRAETLVRGGRFAAAEKELAQALALAEEHEHFDLQVSIHLSIAQMNRTRGRYGAGAADMEKSLEALARANEPFREPAILGNLAMNYILLDADDSARIALERARQVAEKSGRCLDVAAIELLESTRKFLHDEVPFADFQKAVEQWSRTPDVLSVPRSEHLAQLMTTIMGSAPVDPQLPVRSGMLSDGTVELLQAGALFSQGREFALVRELAMKGLEVIPNAKHRAAALAMIGETYVAEGDDDNGIAYFSKAVDALDTAAEEARVDLVLSNSPGASSWSSPAFEVLLQLLVKHHRYEEAFAASERARARVFLQMMGNNRVSPRGPENTLPAQEAETLRTQMLQWQHQDRLAPTRQLDDDLRQARRRYEALMTRVKASNPEYAAMTSVEPLQIDAIREELPSDTALVNYFVTQNGVHAWVLDRTMLQYVPLPFGRTALARAQCTAEQFRVGGRGVRPLAAQCEPATVEELYGWLFAPLRAHIRNSRLIIVPHGVLHYLPFGAFRDPRTERYLIEDFTITYAPSASSIRFLRDKETPVKGKALVIGAPAGVWPELPGAMREAMIVGTELQSVPMVGAAAKESVLYQLKGGVDLVHIAAHGFYEADTPLFSRLALAEGDGSDGNLEVHEILSDIDLTGVNLVVLSACETALGKGSAGDEIVGLTRALLYAGTPGVISTLWDIGDDAAVALMNHFYCRLLSGDSAADALRHAQLQLLRGAYPDPSQWAAFTLNGDPEGRWNASGAIAAVEK
jgi:CHAT domain-containing protein/predicted negative regulator of RcsB-dependent stress response